MRILSLVTAVVFLSSFAGMSLLPGAIADDPTMTERVNTLMSGFETPLLSSGQSGTFSFSLTNPNANSMTNVSLTMSIYAFAKAGVVQPVDNGWDTPYIQNNHEQEFTFPTFDLDALPGENSRRLAVILVTTPDTPHGSPGAYFVRFRMQFDYVNESGPSSYVMASRGYFTDQMWEDATDATNVQNCDDRYRKAGHCLTYLGVDGIIPDSSFSVREPRGDVFSFIGPWVLIGILGGLVALVIVIYLVMKGPRRPPPMEGR